MAKVNTIKKERWKGQLLLQSMVIPGIIWYLVFCYIPMYGVTLAFKDYIFKEGIFGSPWVGLKHFQQLFIDPDIPPIILNTVAIGILKLLFCFPISILFAIQLNELSNQRFKRIVQTVSYFPYFISWVVVSMIINFWLNPRNGILNYFLMSLGIIDTPLALLSDPDAFYGIAVISQIWKETGWSAIIYLAAISGIDPGIYEAAMIDGANKLQRVIHITLPCLTNTIVLMFLLSFAGIFTGGPGTFDQSFFLGNPLNYDKSYVLSYYVLKTGVMQGKFSYATAVGLLNAVVSLILLISCNMVSKKLLGRSIYMEGE